MIPESAVYLGIKVIVLQKNYFSKKKKKSYLGLLCKKHK